MKRRFLPLLAAVLGIVGFGLRMALYALKESTGLLPDNQPLHIATVILSIATATMLLISLRHTETQLPHNPKLAASGAFFASLWMIPVAFNILEQADSPLDFVWALLSFASVPCLILTSWQHLNSRKPGFGTNCILCLFFLAHMICQYPIWCGNPQVEDYLLPLLACVFLSFSSYHGMAINFQSDNRKKLIFCSLMAEFFCICSLAGEGDKRFYLAGALWALSNLYATHQEAPHVSA